jgi:hypothetical protein
MEKKLTTFADWLTRTLNGSESYLAAWKGKFEADPRHAFEWAEGAMDEAARRHLLKHMLDSVSDATEEQADKYRRDMMEHFTQEVLTQAKYLTNHSTSTTSNYMADAHVKAMADLIVQLRFAGHHNP